MISCFSTTAYSPRWLGLKQFVKAACILSIWFLLIACANLSTTTSQKDGAPANSQEQSKQRASASESATKDLDIVEGEGEGEGNSELKAPPQKVLTVSPYRLADEPIDATKKQSFQSGVTALNKQDYLRAQSLFENIIQTHPKHSGAKLNLALALIGQKLHHEAIKILALAIIDNPSNIHALNQLAILQRRQGEFEQAKQHWLDALEKWPDYPLAHYNLGILYDLYLGQFDLALKHYQQYQTYQEKPNRLVRAWIADLERRINRQADN
jgi:tetratricopeptide (TPR) repeat protein